MLGIKASIGWAKIRPIYFGQAKNAVVAYFGDEIALRFQTMQHHHLRVERTAHYYTLGTPGPQVRQLWIVCHGYAQLADEFLENFRLLENDHTLVLAPEGLNHFYRKGFDGPVGATWMTRRHRAHEIADYTHFLQSIYNQYVVQLSPDVRIVLLGFSQGTATVCRWMLHSLPRFHDLVLWAGLPPEDLDYAAHHDYLATKKLYLLYGTSDPFLTAERRSAVQAIEHKNGIDFGEKPFEGGHEILPDTLRELLSSLN
jgi:predicted esterase